MSLPGLKPGPLDPAGGHPPPVNVTMIASNIAEQVMATFHDANNYYCNGINYLKHNFTFMDLPTQEQLLQPFSNRFLISMSSFTFLISVKKMMEADSGPLQSFEKLKDAPL